MKACLSALHPFFPKATLLVLSIAMFYSNQAKAQYDRNWPQEQQRYYGVLGSLCQFIQQHPANISSQQYIIDHYVDCELLRTDTSSKRNAERQTAFGILIARFKHFIDSVGLRNLDAKPAQFWRNDSIAYAPFTNGLKDSPLNCLGYFNKSSPQKPYGYLLFGSKSERLVSWLLINQGGVYYFFQFNML